MGVNNNLACSHTDSLTDENMPIIMLLLDHLNRKCNSVPLIEYIKNNIIIFIKNITYYKCMFYKSYLSKYKISTSTAPLMPDTLPVSHLCHM